MIDIENSLYVSVICELYKQPSIVAKLSNRIFTQLTTDVFKSNLVVLSIFFATNFIHSCVYIQTLAIFNRSRFCNNFYSMTTTTVHLFNQFFPIMTVLKSYVNNLFIMLCSKKIMTLLISINIHCLNYWSELFHKGIFAVDICFQA